MGAFLPVTAVIVYLAVAGAPHRRAALAHNGVVRD